MRVYFAECGGQIKIGSSGNVPARMRQLSSTAAAPISLIGAIRGDLRREMAIHKTLTQHRIKGEWYRDCPEVRATIQNCFNNFDAADPRPAKSEMFGRVCKVIWPTKTAEGLAAEVGCSVRAAAYQISGERPPSDKSMLVLINKIFAR